jgi:imidazole glycerol-phosphate synthase subunit HisH
MSTRGHPATIAVVANGVANLGSVEAAFRRIGVAARVVTDGASVRRADAVVLPGVGAFADAMAALKRHGLVEPIRAAAAEGVPVMGICLGMQLLAEESEEFGRHEGLGLIPGRVVRLGPGHPGERSPNIGWCDVTPAPRATLYSDVPPGTAFYFAHSYVLACRDPEDIAATIRFGGHPVAAAIERDNIHGAQFHPEKSQDGGLAVLAAFAALARKRARYA